MNQKIESPSLDHRVCDQRCCWHWGVGRRVCCRCGNVRVDKPQQGEEQLYR